MAYDRESILRQYPTEITHILEATTADPADEAARMKVATTLARALLFTKTRTGQDRTPADTEVYKLAEVIRAAASKEELEAGLKEALPKARSNILTKYDLSWRLPWSAQEATRRKRGRRPKKVEGAERPAAGPADAKVEAFAKALGRIEARLSAIEARLETAGPRRIARQLDEIMTKLKGHQHDRENGKAYIIEKKEL